MKSIQAGLQQEQNIDPNVLVILQMDCLTKFLSSKSACSFISASHTHPGGPCVHSELFDILIHCTGLLYLLIPFDVTGLTKD